MICHNCLNDILAITFDLDDTLYDNHAVIDRAEMWFNAYIKHNSIFARKSLNNYLDFKKKLIIENPDVINDVTKCRLSTLAKMFQYCGINDELSFYNAEVIMQEFIDVRSSLTVPSSSFTVLRELSKKYQLCAITNGNVDTQRIGLSSYFSHILRANEFLKSKPSTTIFKKVEELSKIPLKNILHVGDDAITDVLGAKQSGMMSCFVRTKYNMNSLKVLPDIEINKLSELRMLANA